MMAMSRFPLDTDARRIGARAVAILHYQIDYHHWQYREMTGLDVGCDCELELAVNNRWCNNRIRVQVKGTTTIQKYILKNTTTISYPLELKTVNYALSSAEPFLLFLVDIVDETCYFAALQEYFIEQEDQFGRLSLRNSTDESGDFNIHIKVDNILSEKDDELCRLAQFTYVTSESGRPLRNVVILEGAK